MPRENKICFVIAPIGKEGSEVRVRSDQVLNHVIKPAAADCGFDTIRADKISEPGLITSQVIQHVVDDPLVVADLTGWNPNVFYELAVRHAVRKPIVQIIQAAEVIPFDVAQSRTVQVDHHDLDSVAKAKDEIVKQIKAAVSNPSEVDNPLSVAVDLQSLRTSGNPLEKSNAEIIAMLQVLTSEVGELTERQDHSERIHPAALDDLMHCAHELTSLLKDGDLVLPNEKMADLEKQLMRLHRVMDHIMMRAGRGPRFGRIFRPSKDIAETKE